MKTSPEIQSKVVAFAALASLCLPLAAPANAAVLYRNVPYDQLVLRGGDRRYDSRSYNAAFQMVVVGDQDGVKAERIEDGDRWVVAKKGENYALRLTNPLPVRVAVTLTVDGINTISGEPSGPSDGRKWIIEPYSTITIRGWQVNQQESRRFSFTKKRASYAAWRGQTLKKDLARNCGVIGAAFFWSRRDLQRYYENHPIYEPVPTPYSWGPRDEMALARRAPSASMGAVENKDAGSFQEESQTERLKGLAKPEYRAGTVMGTRESHPTELVDFDFDSGMYQPEEALVIYYDFASPAKPNPFPNVGYAPEMSY